MNATTKACRYYFRCMGHIGKYWADTITIALEVYYKKELTVYYITYIKNEKNI